MKIEVEFCASEAALLKEIHEQNRDDLRERWGVDSLADMVRLLAMHGADNLGELKTSREPSF